MNERQIPTRPLATPNAFMTAQGPLFSPEQCDTVLSTLTDHGWVSSDQADEDGRHFRSVDAQIPIWADIGEIEAHMIAAFEAVNDQVYRFALSGLFGSDEAHALRYRPGRGHYGWHIDAGFGHPLRKISAVVLLNEAEDFEGGVLEVKGADPIELVRGHAVFFPSFLLHQVTPVTEGERIALVAWIHGPTFT